MKRRKSLLVLCLCCVIDKISRRRRRHIGNPEPLKQQPQHKILLPEKRLYTRDVLLHLLGKTLQNLPSMLQTPRLLKLFEDQLLGFGRRLACRAALLEQAHEQDVSSRGLRLLEAVDQGQREFTLVEVFAEAFLGGVLNGIKCQRSGYACVMVRAWGFLSYVG